MSVLLVSHEDCLEHLAGSRHPERPQRLGAFQAGAEAAGLTEALVLTETEEAPRSALLAVHGREVLDRIDSLAELGGGSLDPDTAMSSGSRRAALLAAGAGLVSVAALEAGVADSAFCAIRPPGHHALADRSMGFCLLNNIAVTARHLASAGERVLIVDYDAHHGNGTQDIFYADPSVLFVSFHQYPFYPGTGALQERGVAAGAGTTLNLPLPAGATGDVYRTGWHEVALPVIERFEPTWVLISAGFDAHRADPLTMMGLSSADIGDLTREIHRVAARGRLIAFLEGGYDLDAVTVSAGACLAALEGTVYRPEEATAGGPGADVVEVARSLGEEE